MKTWNLVNLDKTTRAHMITEFESDQRDTTLLFSKDFSDYGKQQYPVVLRLAFEKGDSDSFIEQLTPDFFNVTRTDKNGRVSHLNREDCARKFGGGQFNQFYMRGLCIHAHAEGVEEIIVYRAKDSQAPREESKAMIGKRINDLSLLADLREHKDIDTHLGLPPGAHSGLSACLPTST
jgi:hypothetical protein